MCYVDVTYPYKSNIQPPFLCIIYPIDFFLRRSKFNLNTFIYALNIFVTNPPLAAWGDWIPLFYQYLAEFKTMFNISTFLNTSFGYLAQVSGFSIYIFCRLHLITVRNNCLRNIRANLNVNWLQCGKTNENWSNWS